MLVSVLGGSLVARQQALGRALSQLPESSRGFRIDLFGLPLTGPYHQDDVTVRRVLATLSPGSPRRVIFFRQLHVQGEAVEIAAVDRLAQIVRLRSGRLPRTCTVARCEVLQIGSGGRAQLDEGGIRLARVGVADLRDPALFGYVSAAIGDSGPKLMLGPSLPALQNLPTLTPFYRVYSWLSPLQADRLRTWDLGPILDSESRAQAALYAADPAFRLSSPDDELLAADQSGEVAANRLVIVGGEASALLLGFAVIAAIGLRRGLASERRRLLARGARRWQLVLALVGEIGSLTLAGAIAGVAVGAVITAAIADAAGLSAGAVLQHGLAEGWTLPVLAGAWLATTAVLALTTLTTDDVSGRRRIRLADVAAVGAAAAVAVGLSRGDLDPSSVASGNTTLLLVLPILVCFVAAVVLARLLAPAMRLAERLTRERSVSLRLAMLALARAPSRTIVSSAFVTVALGLALFAAVYRATLAQGATDQASFAVPLDFTLSEGSHLVPPLDAAPLQRYSTLGGDVRAYPVVRSSATVPGTGSSVLPATVLGIPRAALVRMRWRDDFSSLSQRTIAARLAPAGEPRLVGLSLPAGTATLSVTTRLKGSDVLLELVTEDSRGRVGLLSLGRLRPGARTLLAHPKAAGLRVVGLQIALPATEAFSLGHREAEGQVAQAPAGTIDLGPLLAADRGGTKQVVTAWERWSLPAGGEATGGASGTRIRFAFSDTGGLVFRPTEPTDGKLMPVITSPDVARAAGGVGAQTVLDFQDVRVDATIVGVATRMPTMPSGSGAYVVADQGWLSTAIDADAPAEGDPTEIWVSAPSNPDAVAAALARPPYSSLDLASRRDLLRQLEDDPLAHATALALEAAGIVALALALIGFWVVVVSELGDERSDFFDLEAQGLAPESLRTQLRTRSLILVGLGLAAGIVLGALLSQLVVSVVRVSGTNGVPDPSLRFEPAWLVSGLGVLVLAVVALLVAEGIALTAFRSPRPARASWSLE